MDLFEVVQARLAANAGDQTRRRSGGGKAALCGLVFDAEARPMSPVFSYGRGGRCYRYYVSAPLQQGGSARQDDTLRRVPGQALDDLVLEVVGRLARQSLTTQQARQHVRRIDLFQDSVELLLVRQTLFGQARDPQADIAAIERRLEAEEQVRLDAADPTMVRIILPVRLKTRGGRSWMALPDGRSPQRSAGADPVLVGGLSRAHGVITDIGIRPDGRPLENRAAKAAGSAYQRALGALAFLAPDIQAAIVAGRQPAGLKLEHILRGEIPLAWADQRVRFGF